MKNPRRSPQYRRFNEIAKHIDVITDGDVGIAKGNALLAVWDAMDDMHAFRYKHTADYALQVTLLLMHDRGWWHTGHTSLTDNFQPWLGKGQTK